MADLLGGRVTAYFATPTTSKPHIETGKLRALATTGLTRSVTMPDVPTVAEQGYEGVTATNWYAFVAPAKTPAPVLDRLNQELVKVLQDPGVREQLLKHGLEPQPGSRADLAKTIAAENATWSRVVKDARLTAN
jgi:tripartite-type tricarboxylate transporter receptor subunit TctC